MSEYVVMGLAKALMDKVYAIFYPQLMCSDVCKIFLLLMREHGARGRLLGLTRANGQGHSSCEINLGKRWVCFDVSYNYTPLVSAEQASAEPEKYLAGHPIYNTHREELLELYANRTYHEFG